MNKEIIEDVHKCCRYIDDIEEFIDWYDEMLGMAGCKYDYDKAILELRNALWYIEDCSNPNDENPFD